MGDSRSGRGGGRVAGTRHQRQGPDPLLQDLVDVSAMRAGTTPRTRIAAAASTAVQMRVRGRVQGVGFRPTVWRIARDLALQGDVRNDAEGVLVRLVGPPERIDGFEARL